MKDNLSVVRQFLNEIMSVTTREHLDELTERYFGGSDSLDGELGLLKDDIITIGKELIYLRTGSDDEMGRGLLATLTPQETDELTEAEKIMDENLFDYHYQPIVSAGNGEIFSYEILMRPRGELIKSPLQILKYAGLKKRLNDIEKATFLNTLEALEKTPDMFHGKHFFINSIPKTRLADEDHDRVESLLTKYNRYAVVELTEKAELNEKELTAFKEMYKLMNVQIAIDDYGTGYSNVQNVLRYMPNYVKIDRSLLSGMQDDSKKRHFVREIIEFCHDNGILALAEGVETREELKSVILLGADLIQGYYTARPAAEIIKAIPYKIRQEIKKYSLERQEGASSRIYTADSGEHIDLGRLSKGETSSIVIENDGEYSLSGNPGLDSGIEIDIAENIKADITIENLKLNSRQKMPCIEIGKGSKVILTLKGENRLSMGGIRVPEGSELIVRGDGNLNIILDSDAYFGIGNDINSENGKIVFEQTGSLEVESNGKEGVCIGSGLGGEIELRAGRYVLEINSDRAVGIGSFYRECGLLIDTADVNIDLNAIKGVALGAMNANSTINISSTSVKIYVSGNEAAVIGTLSGESVQVDIHDASVIMNIHTDRCTGSGAIDGATNLKVERAAFRVYAKGDNVLPFGGFTSDTDLSFIDSDVTVKVMTAVKLRDYLPPDRIETLHGRQRIVLNGFEYALKD